MAGVKILGYTILKSSAEREIQALYLEHQKVLLEQKNKLCDDISEWGDALIQSIYKHASLQKYYLEQEFSKQMRDLNETYKAFIQDLHVREHMKNVEEVNQVLEQYKELKFKLSTLEFHAQSTPYIRVPGKQRLSITQPDVFDNAATGRSQFDNGSTEKDNNELTSNMIVNSNPRLNLSYERPKPAE
jgi:hypothetical protein